MKFLPLLQYTGDTSYATTLTRRGVSVRTVEHLLSALSGMNIDNVRVEIDAEEVPIMDGSAGPFVRMILEAGIEAQGKTSRMLKVIKPIFVRDGNKQIAVWPAESMKHLLLHRLQPSPAKRAEHAVPTRRGILPPESCLCPDLRLHERCQERFRQTAWPKVLPSIMRLRWEKLPC